MKEPDQFISKEKREIIRRQGLVMAIAVLGMVIKTQPHDSIMSVMAAEALERIGS